MSRARDGCSESPVDSNVGNASATPAITAQKIATATIQVGLSALRVERERDPQAAGERQGPLPDLGLFVKVQPAGRGLFSANALVIARKP